MAAAAGTGDEAPTATWRAAPPLSEMIPLPLRVAIDGKAVGEGGRTDDDATRIEGDLARRIVAMFDGGSSGAQTGKPEGEAEAMRPTVLPMWRHHRYSK